MPPKKAAAAPAASFPAPSTVIWDVNETLSFNAGSDAVKAYAPTGNLRLDMLSYALLLQVPLHPGIFPLKPEAETLPVSTSPEPSQKGGKAAAKPEEKAEPDVRSGFRTEGPADTFSVTGWSLDAGTFTALTLALPACPTLTTLRFSSCGLSSQQLHTLTELLQRCPTIKHVAIDFNPLPVANVDQDSKLSEEEVSKLMDDTAFRFETLTASKLGLVSLSLRGNNLGTEAAAAIGANLRVNSVLEALNVAHNRLGDDGLCQLAPGLRDNRCLKYLSLADNGFTPASAPVLVSCFASYTLTKDEVDERVRLEESLFGPVPPSPAPATVDPKLKGKAAPAAKGAPPPPARPSFPILLRNAADNTWTGVGNYAIRSLDVHGNGFGDGGLATVVTGLFQPRTEREAAEAAAFAALPRSTSPGKGKAAPAPEAPAKPTPDAAIASGSLVLPVFPAALKLYASLNAASPEAVEELLSVYGVETGEALLSLK